MDMGREIRESRLNAGLSLRTAGASVGMSHSQFGRIERAQLADLTVEQLCLAAAAVGLKLGARAFPAGDPVRDAAQLALIARLRDRLPASVKTVAEAPLPIAADRRRAWDLLIHTVPSPVGVEAETRLRDVQALQRRLALKQRDGGIESVVLLVSDTASNRRALSLHGDDLRPTFPLSGRQVLTALGAGRTPSANGVLVI
jgi:transcriptional regulator with XRE-family HTH domain